MIKKRFHKDMLNIVDVLTNKAYTFEFEEDLDEMLDLLNSLYEENEQLRTQLLICQQSKNDDGQFKVWQVPPIRRHMRVSTTTIDNEQKRDSKRWRWSE